MGRSIRPSIRRLPAKLAARQHVGQRHAERATARRVASRAASIEVTQGLAHIGGAHRADQLVQAGAGDQGDEWRRHEDEQDEAERPRHDGEGGGAAARPYGPAAAQPSR